MIATTILATAHTYMASPIWDIGLTIRDRGIDTAVFFLLAGTGLVAAATFLFSKNKTHALKVLGIGIVIAGVVSALPSLGVVSKDSVNGLTHSTSYR